MHRPPEGRCVSMRQAGLSRRAAASPLAVNAAKSEWHTRQSCLHRWQPFALSPPQHASNAYRRNCGFDSPTS